jgi:hypothetical protein
MTHQNSLVANFRAAAVNALTQLRQEWSDTTTGDSLIDVQASVGLLFYDIVNILNLTPEECEAVLGSELHGQTHNTLSLAD